MSKRPFLIPLLAGIFLFVSSNVQALQTYAVKDQEKVDVTLSATETNRISLQGDRIHQVFGVTDAYTLETDEQGGQIFLKALSSDAKPVTLTLVSEKGLTYDLRLTLQKTDAQSIVLTGRERGAHASQRVGNDQDLLAFLKDMATQAPRDDVFSDRTPAKQLRAAEERITQDAVATLLMTYEDDDFQGLVFGMRSKRPYGVTLSPKLLARSGEEAVALQNTTLEPFASTRAYVVRRKDG